MAQTILTVDPSPVRGRFVALALGRAGYEVVEARDGRDALKLASVVSFDLVITDHDMPHIDGLTMIRALRTRPANAGHPILVLARETDDDTQRAARAAGATGWLPRTIDLQTLLDVVGTAIGRPWTIRTGANGTTSQSAWARQPRAAKPDRSRATRAFSTIDPQET